MEDRRNLWREHLTSFKTSGLTSPQRATLDTVIARLDRYVDEPHIARAALERDGFTPERLKADFGAELAKRIFATLGPVGSANVSSDAQSCECSSESDWCGSQTSCVTGACMPRSCCCGTLWCYPCDGNCLAS